MYPTIQTDDYILVNQISYGIMKPFYDELGTIHSQPQTSDIVTIKNHDRSFSSYFDISFYVEAFDKLTLHLLELTNEPNRTLTSISRIIANPGDYVSYQKNRIIINNRKLGLKKLNEDNLFLETNNNKSYYVNYANNDNSNNIELLYIPKKEDKIKVKLDRQQGMIEFYINEKLLIKEDFQELFTNEHNPYNILYFRNRLLPQANIMKKKLLKDGQYHVSVTENFFLVMGDNRNLENWELLPQSYIIAKAFLIFCPIQNFNNVLIMD